MTRFTRFAVPAMLVLMFAAPMAMADTTSSSTMASDSSAKPAKKVDPHLDDKAIVCKREETTGSRLGATKECHTRGEWAAMAAEAREQSSRIINTPQTH
jgi:hypothetical protein